MEVKNSPGLSHRALTDPGSAKGPVTPALICRGRVGHTMLSSAFGQSNRNISKKECCKASLLAEGAESPWSSAELTVIPGLNDGPRH